MIEEDTSYHKRRAATQRSLASRCTNPAAAMSHVTLAELHESRARRAGGGRPVLGIVRPG